MASAPGAGFAGVPAAGLGVGFAATRVPDFAAAALAAVADFDAVDLADVVDLAAVDLVEAEVADFDAVADFDDVLAFVVDDVAEDLGLVAARVD